MSKALFFFTFRILSKASVTIFSIYSLRTLFLHTESLLFFKVEITEVNEKGKIVA